MHTRMNRVRGYKTTTGRYKFVYINIHKNNEKKYESFDHWMLMQKKLLK